MRYGILGDIHANLEAFRAVLDTAGKEGISQYLCVGDIVGYAANPSECIGEIEALAAVTVAGNHDWAAAGLFGTDYFNRQAKEAVSWTRARLDPKERDFLALLKLLYRGKDLTLVHGTLDNPQDFNYMLDARSASKSFGLLDTKVCFIGHTHIPAIFVREQNNRILSVGAGSVSLEEGKKYIVNVGSVGQPRDGDPRAAYCIYDTVKKEIRIKRIAYDIETASKKIIAAGLPRSLGERILRGA